MTSDKEAKAEKEQRGFFSVNDTESNGSTYTKKI